MQTEDTVYLYSKEQSHLYGDVLHELEARTCPHTHTVYALMDAEESEVPEKMANHVSTCRECQKTVLLSQAVTARINSLIPEFENLTPVALTKNNKKMFFKNEFSTVSRAKNAFDDLLKAGAENLLDVFSVIFSVKMGLTYVTAIFLALFLNWVL